MTDLQECVQFLVTNEYMAVVKNKYIVTAKFNKAMTGKEQGLVLMSNNVPAVKEPLLPDKKITYEELYMRFITEAEVPARLSTGKGDTYDVNKYSEAGMKAFRRALDVDKVDFRVLVNSTKLYYKSSSGYKMAIGRYMSEGVWKTDYLTLFEAAKSGTVDEHVKQQTKDNGFSRYELG